MANKKVSQLTSKPSVLVTDLFPIADPSTGQLYKTTISDLGTAIGSGVSSVNGLVGAVVLDTDDIQELVSPTNKWFTDTRARAAISAGTGISYNSGTGVITNAVTSGQIATALGYTPANDASVVHLAGTETISGLKTFTNNVVIRPSTGYNAYFQTSSGAMRINFLDDALTTNVSAAFRANDYSFQCNATVALTINSSAAAEFTSSVTASSFIKSGGTSSQFLKADGSVDSSTYALDSAVVKLTGDQTIAGVKTFSNRIVVDIDTTTNNAAFFKNVSTNGYGVSIQGGVGTNYALYVSNNVGSKVFEVLGNGATSIIGSLAVTGTGSFTGSLSGTSATFSSTITGNRNDNFTNVSVILQNSYINAGNLINFVHNSGGSTTNGYIGHGGDSTGNFVIINNAINALSLARATGAATFSSSVTAGSWIITSNNLFTGGNNTGVFLTGSTSDFSWGLNRETAGLTLYAGSAVSPKMTITSSGYLGIGTTAPNYSLQVNSSGTITRLQITNSTTGTFSANGFQIIQDGNNNTFSLKPSGFMSFETTNSERMRITSGGNVLIGTSSDNGIKFQVSGDTYATGYVYFKNQASTNNFAIYGSTNILIYNSAVGNIANINASTGIYTPTSDKNKKKDFEVSNIGLNEVMQLKPTLYRMKSDESEGQKELGFIAQDVKSVIPNAYVESGDFIGLNFNPIVAALTKAVQELKAELDTLKNK